MEKSVNPLLKPHDVSSYPILTLAYMGDTVLESFVREYIIINHPNDKPGILVTHSRAFVTCEAQSDAIERILPKLDESESDIYRRGRNAKTHYTPRHGDVIQYRRATGFEALMGYLYLCGRYDRAKELFLAAYQISDTEGQEK